MYRIWNPTRRSLRQYLTAAAAEIVEDDRTDGERMRELAAYVRMMG